MVVKNRGILIENGEGQNSETLGSTSWSCSWPRTVASAWLKANSDPCSEHLLPIEPLQIHWWFPRIQFLLHVMDFTPYPVRNLAQQRKLHHQMCQFIKHSVLWVIVFFAHEVKPRKIQLWFGFVNQTQTWNFGIKTEVFLKQNRRQDRPVFHY